MNRGFDIGVNQSYLTYNVKGLDNRLSSEFRLGVFLEKSIGQNFAIKSGIRLGIKPRTTIYFAGYHGSPQYQYLSTIDETLGKRDHYFMEIPIALVFNWRKFQAGSGILARHYFNDARPDDYDFIGGRDETGIYSMLGYKLGDNLKVALEGYFGISSIIDVYYAPSVVSSGALLKAKNNFIGLSFGYEFH